ncbi:MAG: peptidylprolyl isomerase [Planctomycetes bacterium]|nr:peptidylprolyl isomerase [Planctomycetota bacterium]
MRVPLVVLLGLVCLGCRSTPNLREARVEPRPALTGSDSVEAEAAPADVGRRAFPQPLGTSGRGPGFLAWPRADDRVVATVGDEELRKSQVFDAMLETMPEETRGTIAVLLANRVLAAECARHGIEVPGEEVDGWYRAQEKILRSRAEAEFGTGADFSRFMELRFGQTPAQYERTAKDRERARRLLARLIRFQELLEDRVELRIISVTDRSLAQRLREQVDVGADFEILAEQYSVHPSAESGGLMVPVWRGTLNAELDQVAFDLSPGGVSPVIHARDQGGRDRFQIIKLVRRLPGRALGWREVEDEVVAGIVSQPLSQDEWYMWQLRLERSGKIKLHDL